MQLSSAGGFQFFGKLEQQETYVLLMGFLGIEKEWNWSTNCFSVCVLGGKSTAENCQILQTRVNRFKSDKEKVDETQLKDYSCDLKFTGMFALFSFLHFL